MGVLTFVLQGGFMLVVGGGTEAFLKSAPFLLLLILLYSVIGFFAGIIGALIYNAVVSFTGGIKFEFEEVEEAKRK